MSLRSFVIFVIITGLVSIAAATPPPKRLPKEWR